MHVLCQPRWGISQLVQPAGEALSFSIRPSLSTNCLMMSIVCTASATSLLRSSTQDQIASLYLVFVLKVDIKKPTGTIVILPINMALEHRQGQTTKKCTMRTPDEHYKSVSAHLSSRVLLGNISYLTGQRNTSRANLFYSMFHKPICLQSSLQLAMCCNFTCRLLQQVATCHHDPAGRGQLKS